MSTKPDPNRQRPRQNLTRPGQDELAKTQLAKEKSALRHSFLMGVGSTVAIGFVAYGAFNSFMPKKNEVSGTWRLTDNAASGFALPINAVVTNEGKLLVQNPESPDDYVDLGRLSRISETNTIPKSAQVSTFASRNRNRAAQADAKSQINLLNIAQMAHQTEKEVWGSTWSDLGIKLESETDYYTYTTTIEKGIQTITPGDLVKIGKPYPGVAIQQAVPKQAKLRSYLGVAYVVFDSKSNQLEQLKLICESSSTVKGAIPLPEFNSKKNAMVCPPDFVPIEVN